MRKPIQLLFAFAVLLAALCPTLPAQAKQALDADEMEAFFDDYLGTQMEVNHIAGAAVAIVKDGQVLFIKGYGFADVEKDIPVDAEQTVFTLGSLSKLFTWTAVMQLVERGQLDLNTNVNVYLDFKIPTTLRQAQGDAYPEPITLNHLMSHTSGFEDNYFDQMTTTSGELIPLGEWLKTHIPARVHRPGEVSAYSNYGAALAGYIVERVSGLSYDDYVEQNILGALGMIRTTSRQPVPAALTGDLSQCYRFIKGEYQPQPATNVVLHVAPAGSFRATAADMARFMIAHLNEGQYGDASLLQPATAELMHSQSFTHDPHMNGMAHGFWELDMNGQEIIGHAGSHFIFNSMLMLFPEQELGVFIVTNSQGGNNFIGGNFFPFQKAFVDHFFPQDLPVLTPPSGFAQRASHFTGSYHFTMGRSETTPQKLTAMLMTINVQADQSGLTATLPSSKEHFVEVEPLVFRQVNDDALLVFRENGSGNVTQAFYSPAPLTALEKNRWFEAPAFNLSLLAACIILFLSYLIAALIASFIRRKGGEHALASSLERVVQTVASLTSFLCLALLFSAFASLFNTLGLYTGTLPLWTFIPLLSIIIVLLTLSMIGFTLLSWKQGFWSLTGRIHYTLVTLGAVGFVWFMYFWNLLGKGFSSSF